MSDRGMKKWAPYKSLVEQDPALMEMRKNRTKIDRPKISSEEAEAINEILINYQGEVLIVSLYKNGEILEQEITIKRIDPYERKLILTNRKIINLHDVVGLKRKE